MPNPNKHCLFPDICGPKNGHQCENWLRHHEGCEAEYLRKIREQELGCTNYRMDFDGQIVVIDGITMTRDEAIDYLGSERNYSGIDAALYIDNLPLEQVRHD